jgi:hypothetical protein
MRLYLKDALTFDEINTLSADANIFNHPSWHKTIAATYGFKPIYIMMEAKTSEQGTCVLAVMPVSSRRWVSFPFTDSFKLLSVNEYSENELLLELNQLRKSMGVQTMEIRWPLPASPSSYTTGQFFWHTTALMSNPEVVIKHFTRPQIMRNIRKAIKEGVTVRMCTSWEDMRLFYSLHLKTRHRQGVPIQPLNYFQNLYKNVIDQGLGFILLAYQGQQLLAGAVFLHWHQTLTYKYGASDERFLKLRPNNLIMWEAMRWGCENGYQTFDWGRTDLEDQGLRDFKLSWGSEEKILQYTFLADHPPKPDGKGKIAIVMKTLIQRSPLWVCRLIGELFYRYAA